MRCCSFNIHIREFRSRVTPFAWPALAHISTFPHPPTFLNLTLLLKQHVHVSNTKIRPFIIGSERYRPGLELSDPCCQLPLPLMHGKIPYPLPLPSRRHQPLPLVCIRRVILPVFAKLSLSQPPCSWCVYVSKETLPVIKRTMLEATILAWTIPAVTIFGATFWTI
ncbi:hypothetical protein DL98DRAFT_122014 [Cadophora sp. DSE1049]|nr:hypothetical protein DL98DRAFT_122014 [Cadophora sp. DSE1049]